MQSCGFFAIPRKFQKRTTGTTVTGVIILGALCPIDRELTPVASFVYYGSSFKFPIYSGAVSLQKGRNLSNGQAFESPVFNLLTF